MFTVDDSNSNRAMRHPAVAVEPSATPIYDLLETEWKRLFRAVPHDRAGEDFGSPASTIHTSYGTAVGYRQPGHPPSPHAYGSLAFPAQGAQSAGYGGFPPPGRHRGAALVPAQFPAVPAGRPGHPGR